MIGDDDVPTPNEAKTIAERWFNLIGIGFHPDTQGDDYSPKLSREQAIAYDRDMARLFELSDDPYEICLELMPDF